MVNSAKKLAEALGGKAIRRDSVSYKPKWNHMTINWGCSKLPSFVYNREFSLNFSENIGKATNKLETFKILKKTMIPHPYWTTDYDEVRETGGSWVARLTLTGFGGMGIIYSDDPNNLPVNAPLYVKYQKKKHEYRVHVVGGSVIDITQKKRKLGVPNDSKIRNYKNGWVYCRENITIPDGMELIAIRTIRELGLHFGAVDIIWNELQNKCYVLEVNTAPGLTGTTLLNYSNAFKEYLNVQD